MDQRAGSEDDDPDEERDYPGLVRVERPERSWHGRHRPDSRSGQIGVRLDPAIRERLAVEAKRQGRTLTNMATYGLTRWVQTLTKGRKAGEN